MEKKYYKLTTLIIAALLLFTGLADRINNSRLEARQSSDSKKNTFSLNFNDVEISEFINIMSKLIGKNIILSDKVKGKITISSAREVPVSEAFNIMKSILEIKGFAVIETDNLIKIVPIKEAIQKNTEVIIDGDNVKLETENAVTFLLQINNADANDIMNVLKAIKSPDTDIVVYKSLNTLIFTGNSIEIKGLVQVAISLDKKPEDKNAIVDTSSNIHVVNLENADAVTLAEVLSRIPFSQNAVINTNTKNTGTQPDDKNKTQNQPNTQKLSIIANKETNSLIINATPDEFKEIYNVIKQLDIVRPQILIEAMIVEINLESDWGLGIDWSLGGSSGKNLFAGQSLMGGIPDFSVPDALEDKTIAVPLSSETFSLGYMNDSSMLGFVLLNATGKDEKINIISTPHILTLDNHESEINVVEEIAVPTNSRISEDNTIYYTFEYKPVGLKLKLTPHITDGKKIVIDLYVETNQVLGQTTTTTSGTIIPPDLGKRDMKTKVIVIDGSTIVVGGLIKKSTTETEIKVPILGDIPLLGWFFKNKQKEDTKSNLLVFITPKIVTDSEKMKIITSEKEEELKKMKEESEK